MGPKRKWKGVQWRWGVLEGALLGWRVGCKRMLDHARLRWRPKGTGRRVSIGQGLGGIYHWVGGGRV